MENLPKVIGDKDISFLVVNLVLVSMFRVCCETGPIFVPLFFGAYTKKSPNRKAWKPLPVGGKY